jgi:ketosteroid isomerase-like protein
MSSANLDIVRSIYADWGRGDWSVGDWAHPEIEFVLADGPDPSSWVGVSASAEAWRQFLSAWTDYRGQAREFREIDDERVYVLIHVTGRGKTSGLAMERLSANLLTLRSGKVTRLAVYWDAENALAELGLAPEK